MIVFEIENLVNVWENKKLGKDSIIKNRTKIIIFVDN